MSLFSYLKSHSRQAATIGCASLSVAAAGLWVPLIVDTASRPPIAVVSIPDDQPAPSASVAVRIDANGHGIVDISAEHFRFTDLCQGQPVEGTLIGHAHVYVDNRKVAVATSPRIDIGPVPAGDFQVSVSLHDLSHRFLMARGQPVIAMHRVSRTLALAR